MLSLRTPIGLGAALSASLAASFLAASPAQAQAQAPGGGFPGGIEGTAVVAACGPAPINGGTIFGANFACQVGDKIYSNFVLKNDVGGKLANGFWLLTEFGTNHSISVSTSGNFTPGFYSYGYKMTVFDAIASGQSLQSVRTDAANASIGGANIPAWTKTLNVLTSEENLTTIATRAGGISTDDGPATFNAAVKPTSADFISDLFVNNLPNNFTPSFVDGATQKFDDQQKVPGPLPILGAAAAFGFSRKLRSRIKQTV